MKILLVSAFTQHHPTLQPGQYLQKTGDGLKKGFEKLGHTVDPFDYRHIEEISRGSEIWEYRLKKRLKKLNKLYIPEVIQRLYFLIPGIKRMNRKLCETVKQNSYDLIVFTKAELVNYRNVKKFSQSSSTWFLFIDSLSTAQKQRADKYAIHATVASGTRSNVVDYFVGAGADARFLTQGVDTDYLFPAENLKKVYDVVFAGTISEWRKKYIMYLKDQGINVVTFGKNADNPIISGNKLGEVYRTSKIILDLKRTGDNIGFSSRIFEVMGCGTFLLTEYCKDIEMLFENNKELVWFQNPQECAELVRTYLQNEEDRERIARTGSVRMTKEFTWKAIAEKICSCTEGK